MECYLVSGHVIYDFLSLLSINGSHKVDQHKHSPAFTIVQWPRIDMDKYCVGVFLLVAISLNCTYILSGGVSSDRQYLFLCPISFSGATLSTRIRFL